MEASTRSLSESEISTAIRGVLGGLHIPPNLLGYHYLVYSIEAVALDPMRIRGITKDLYRETASAYGTTASAVEHDIRTAVETCWKHGGRKTLREMANCYLTKRPSNARFISVVAMYIRSKA